METTTDQVASQETEARLQLKRPLLPIDEYAAREGVSRGVVEECGRLGIVQIRKCKGKTFVVDMPISPYSYAREVTEEQTEPIDKRSHLAKGSQNGKAVAQVKSKRRRQIATVFLTAFLFAALFANLWLYTDRKTHFVRLDQAYAGTQKAYDDFAQAHERTETLQNELNNSKAEIGRLKNELENSRAEVETARNELTRAGQNFETIQQRNAEAIERLNGQIQKLTARLSELTKAPQTSSGSGTSANPQTQNRAFGDPSSK